MIAALDVKEGMTVYVTRSDDNSLKIQAHNPALLADLTAAEEVMDENGSLLEALSWANRYGLRLELSGIIHDRQIARNGGASGLCDGGLLQNALQRPVNKRQYENADIFESAAHYAFGITKANTFFDGNKRTAFVSSVFFLRLNGWHFVTEPVESVEFMEGFASD